MDTSNLDTTCDGMFLIVDCARHMGLEPDQEDIEQHVRECADCFDRNTEV